MQSFIKELGKNKVLFLMMIPAGIILIINNYIPMFGAFIAFKDYNYEKGILYSDWSGFKNFEFFLKTPDAFLITKNTILYNLVFIVLGTFFAVAFAVALNELGGRLNAKFYQTSMFFPYFLSWVVVSYLGYAFFSMDYGYLNRILQNMGMEPIMWYNEPSYWPIIIVLFFLWKTTGYNSVIYLASITSLDSEMFEAAWIDGANKWQQITRITLPLLTPVITIMTLFSIGSIMRGDFGLFYQVPMRSGPLVPTTQIIDTYVYRSLIEMHDFGMSSAAALYQSFVGFILVVFSNWLVRKYQNENALF